GRKARESQNGGTRRPNRSSLSRQPSLSQSASNISRDRNAASHSSRQSARSRRGTITPMNLINKRCGFRQSLLSSLGFGIHSICSSQSAIKSFVSERDQGINFCGAPPGNDSGRKGH